MSLKPNHRSSYNSAVSKQKQNLQNAFFLSEANFITIYHAQLFEQYLLLCTKKSIDIYNTQNFIKEYQIAVKTHFACFVPFTTLIVYPQVQDNLKNVLVFWNYKTKKIQAQMILNFQIQTIKASRRCISLANMQHLYVLHFPTLNPIYEGFAGNGFKVVYDISREGLTIAHQTPKKGELAIKNFTNLRTNKLLLDINSRSRTQSLNKFIREKTYSQIQKQAQEQLQQEIKNQHYIKAHNQNINLIRMSPNGYRVITASSKGTIIRLFSTLNGENITEFRMSNDICAVVDVCFNSQGSQIVCLNENNQVNLFQARMSQVQLISQSSRRGAQIYQMKNPSSFFSFLGFLNVNLKNQYPFSYFKLDTKGIQIKEKRYKLEAQLKQKQQKPKSHYITEIKEVHQSHLQAQGQIIESNESVNQKQGLKDINKPQTLEVSQTFKSIDVEQVDINFLSPKPYIQKKNSISGLSKFDSIRSKSIVSKKPGSLKSLGKLSKKPSEVVKFGQKESNMHFKGVINFGDITNVKVLQSKYYFQLKYDPFNGGRMIQKIAFNILKHPRFSDL